MIIAFPSPVIHEVSSRNLMNNPGKTKSFLTGGSGQKKCFCGQNDGSWPKYPLSTGIGKPWFSSGCSRNSFCYAESPGVVALSGRLLIVAQAVE
jgi:hypothetical protein